jgi:hypothetical protein
MKKLFTNLESLIKKNWKPILIITLLAYFLYSYADIKKGIMDGWMGK